MLSWMSRNKGKLLILYAIKVALFIPHVAFAYTAFTWDDYAGGTAEISNLGVYTVTGVSNVIFTGTTSPDNQAVNYTGAGGITPGYPYPYDTLNNTIYSNFGTGVWYGMVCFGVSGGGGGDCVGFPERQLEYSINVTGTDTPSFPNTNITLGTSTCGSNPETRIIDFDPQDGATTTSPVSFALSACINADDIGTIKGVNITLHNIDQNVLLLGSFSPNDIILLDDENVQTPGLYNFSTSTVIGDGNYRIEACVERSYFFGFIINPLSSVSDCVSHQFIVGTSTFIGNISQRIYGDTNDFFAALTATSSEALAATCNPIGGNFGVRECSAFLFIPDAAGLNATMEDARTGILSRVPWGYFTRVVTILNTTSTTTLPSWTASIQVGPGSLTPEITTITIDPGDMLAGGATLLESVHDPITNKSPRDVFYPMVQLTVALAVLMTIIADLTRAHHAESEGRSGKLS